MVKLLRPDDYSLPCRTLYEQVLNAVRKGDMAGATQVCKRLLREFPRFPFGWAMASRIAAAGGRLSEALTTIELALELQPGDSNWLIQKIEYLARMRRFEEARKLVEELALEPDADADELVARATVHVLMGDHATALQLYRAASARDPGNPGPWFSIASMQRFLGYFDEAERSYDRGLSMDPEFWEGYYVRTGLRRQSAKDNHIAELQSILDKTGVPTAAKVWLYYALGKEYEDLERYDEAFLRFEEGARLKRGHMKYDVAEDILVIEQIIETFDRSFLEQAHGGFTTESPIFVIGMPRSGTTLVERILGSHSDVRSAGEINDFALEMMALVEGTGSRPSTKSEMVRASTRVDVAQLGENYTGAVRGRVGESACFIDKLPWNFLYCGLISLALPNARLIEVNRDPMDTCISMYKQLFTHAYPYSYDLDELWRYLLAYRRLMDHWQRVLPGRIHQIQYEKLVADPAGEVRSLLNYCNLPWQEACREFHTNPDACTTASAVQVRQPIHAGSIGAWKHYRRHLQRFHFQLSAADER